MPAIQDVYSINVSNRFALAIDNEIDEGNESDNYGDFDPLDQLRLLEEQKKKDRIPKKKNKAQTQQENDKTVSSKKEVQFKENRDANVPAQKRSSDKKEEKPKKDFSSRDSSGKSARGGDRPPPGDENRRPARQNNQRPERQPPRDRGGEGDQYNKPYYDNPSERPNRRGPTNATGEGRMDRRDRGGNRYERYRGGRGGFGGPRGGFGYRNNYRSDGRDDRGKREFDRRSGSDKAGVRPSDKRDGAGARNWGTPGNEFDEAVENTTFESEEVGNWSEQPEAEEQGEEKPNTKPAGENEEKKDDAPPVETEETEEDCAPTEMTLDEWKAKQINAGKKKQFNIRKAGEGEESGKWTNMKVIHESTGNKPTLHHVVTDDNLRSTTTKPVIDVNIRFDMPPRSGRGGRGGRGFRGGRGSGGYRGGQRGGGGGRYGNRYGNQHPPPPDVLNEKEFPTLPAA